MTALMIFASAAGIIVLGKMLAPAPEHEEQPGIWVSPEYKAKMRIK
jgi:hypothetical protein